MPLCWLSTIRLAVTTVRTELTMCSPPQVLPEIVQPLTTLSALAAISTPCSLPERCTTVSVKEVRSLRWIAIETAGGTAPSPSDWQLATVLSAQAVVKKIISLAFW